MPLKQAKNYILSMCNMKKLLFTIIAGLFVAGIASASLGEYWSTISHIIPRTNDTVDIGSTAKRVRTIFTNNLTCTDCVDDTNVDWGTGTNQVSSADMPDHNSHTVRDTFVHTINRGVTSTVTVTLTGGLGVSWIAGELYCQSCETFFAVDSGSGTCTNNAVNYLKWVSGTTLTLSTVEPSGNEILVAVGSTYDGNINGYREVSPMNETVGNTRRGLRALFPTRIISGMSVHEDTDVTNPLDVTMDAGVVWKDAIEKMTPVEIKSRNTAMVRNFHTGGVWDSDTNAQIETTNYDNGTDKTAIPANKYVKGMFIYMSGKIGFVYPTEYFNTIAQAQDGALPTMPPGLEPIPKLTAIVYQQGAVNFTNSIWQDVRAGISEESFSGVTDHGALAGLGDDDHTIYLLADGSRNLGGAWNLGGQNLTNGGTITASFTGALTGQADTVATITGLAPDTATTQATQAGITTCTNLTTVGTIGTGVWNGTALTSTYIGNDQVLESHLKSVNAATDEYCLTYEATTGDFEWQVCSAGAGDITDVFDCTTGDCNTMTVGTSEYLTYGTGYIDANRFAGITTVDGTEFGYLNGLTAAIVQTGSASHDGFSDFVANEHLDWTADLGAVNIHAGNYTNTTYTGGTNITLVDTTFNVDDSFLANDGDIGTGVYDFGGAVVEIPNGAAPTVDSVGETALDTTSDQFIYYGGAKRVLTYQKEICFTLEDPVDADDNIPFYFPRQAITITDVYCQVDGGTSVAMVISDGTNALESITCDADGAQDDGSITNGAFTSLERMEFDLDATSGTNTWLNICVTYTITAD